MTVISSYQAQFQATGVQETKAGFAEIAKAAALADRQQRVNTQNLKDYAKQQIQTERELAREAQKTAAAQERMAAKTKFSLAPGLTSATDAAKNFISQNAALIGAVVAVGAAGVKAYQSFQAYAGSVRDVALASGTSAPEASKLLQVLDDYEITAQDVMVATKAMTKNGLEPSIDTLAKLSDEYRKINDPMEKNAFILKNLGKAGLQWANALNQGGDALRKAGDEVNKSLILTDEQIKKAEKARLAVDSLADAWEGAKVAVGGAIGDLIVLNQQMTDYEDMTGKTAQQNGLLTDSFKAFQGQMARGAAMTEFYKNQQQDLGAIEEDNTNQLKATSDAYASQWSIIQNVQSETEKFTDSNAKLNDKLQELQDKQSSMRSWTQGYKDVGVEIDATKQSIADLAKAHEESSNKIVFDLMVMKAASDGWQQGEFENMLKIAEGFGIVDAKTVETAINFQKQSDAMAKAIQAPLNGVMSLADMWMNLAELSKSGIVLTASVVSAATNGAMGGSSGSGTCFTGDTPVTMADGTTKPIKDIQIGDYVLSYDTTHRTQIHTTVVEVFEHPANEGGRLLLLNNYLKVTEEHLLWNGFAWVAAGLFQVGDLLMNQDGSFTAVRSIRELVKNEPTYNIHVDHEVHNYFAGGVLVHNAKSSNAGGGKLSSGWTLVGDRPGGGFVDGVSELIYNGVVYSSAVSKKLIKSGVVGGFASRAQPSDEWGTAKTSTPTSAITTSTVKNNGVQMSGGGTSTQQAAEMQVQTQSIANQAQTQISNMMTQLQQSQQAAQSVFQEMLNVLRSENPRAIGKQVSYELSKVMN
jgi:hypothetical protein